MEEIKLNMENLTKEEREQLLKLVEKANKKESKVYKPQDGDEYFFIDDQGKFLYSFWNCSYSHIHVDTDRYSMGNCFKTKEEAEFALERHKVIVELERFAKDPNLPVNVYLYCYEISNCEKNGMLKNAVAAGRYYSALGTVAFSDVPTANNAIKTIGEDRLKKYYFGIVE